MKIRKRKKYIKKRRDLVDQVVAILDDIDPMGILFSAKAAGFNIDKEYIPEAEEIVLKLGQCNNVRSLEIGLKQIFDYYFYYPDVPEEYYQLIARKLLNTLFLERGKKPIKFSGNIKVPEHLTPVLIVVD